MVPKLMACAFSISQKSQGEVAGDFEEYGRGLFGVRDP